MPQPLLKHNQREEPDQVGYKPHNLPGSLEDNDGTGIKVNGKIDGQYTGEPDYQRDQHDIARLSQAPVSAVVLG